MCTRPMARLETTESYKNKQGGISFKAQFCSWEEVEHNIQYYNMKYKKVDQVACGQCMECRMNYAREWANRIVLEKSFYPEDSCWFVTLTYDEDHIPFHRTVNTETGETYIGTSLKKEHFTKFMKDLRRYYQYHYNITGIRFFMCGEYGSAIYTSRPHYHVILFGLPLDMTKLKKSGTNDLGQPYFHHPEIDEIWGNGRVEIGRVTWESACYVARYTLKKRKGKDAAWYYGIQGKIPEYVNMSRKPGIGMRYFEEHKEDIYTTNTIPIANKKSAQLVPPPKAFDREMEKLEPEFMKELKRERKRRAEQAFTLQMQQTDNTRHEYRKSKEEVLAQLDKLLPRKEI